MPGQGEHKRARRSQARMMPPRFLCLLAAVLFAAGVIFGPAACGSPSASTLPAAPASIPSLHWPSFPVHVFVEAKTPDEVQKALVVLAGLDEWVDATHEKVCYIRTADPNKADITVRFQTGRFLGAGTNVIGDTTVLWSGTTLKKASIRLAEGVGNLEDLQADAAHEFGHALGIEQHSDNRDDLMFPVEMLHFSERGDPLPLADPVVTAHDVERLAACYPQLLGKKLSHP